MRTRRRHIAGGAITIISIFLTFMSFSQVRAQWVASGPNPLTDGQISIPPNNFVTGGIQSVLAHPTNINIIYVGAVNGGIWRTIDGGTTWTPLTDHQASLTMGGMALDPASPNNILAGFGNFSNFRGAGGPSQGLILSNDSGTTWTPVGGAITLDTNISSVLVNGPVMFAASRSAIDGAPFVANTGLFRSVDGGLGWIRIDGSGGLPRGSVTSLGVDPGNSNIVYAAFQNQGVFVSTDGGRLWTNITDPGMGIGPTTQNLQLSVGAGGALFVGVVGFDGQLASVWRSQNQGLTWQDMGLPGTVEAGTFMGITPGEQGDINFTIQADPTNPNLVYVGGDRQPSPQEINPALPMWPNSIGATDWYGRLFRGDASLPPGLQWTPITDNFTAGNTAPHADSRGMAIDVNGDLLQGDDGGLYRRVSPQNNAGDWSSLNGNLQVTEFYSLTYGDNTNTMIGGAQDVGSPMQNPASTAWQTLRWGDGAKTAINDQHPAFSLYYVGVPRLGTYSGADSNFTRVQVDNTNAILDRERVTLMVGALTLDQYEVSVGSTIPWLAPLVLNRDNKDQLATGTHRIYIGTDDPTLLPDTLNLTDISTNNFANGVSSIAYGIPGNPNILLAGEGNRLWLSTTLLSGSLTQLMNYNGGNIRCVFINPNTANSFYVADGRSARSTDDQGVTWTKGLSLPNLYALEFITGGGLNAVVAGGYGLLYVARDTDLDNWYSLTGNLPNTFIWDMDYCAANDTLAVGMLGRGAFTLANASTLLPPTPVSVEAGWIRLLRGTTPSQTVNGGILQTPDSLIWGNNITLGPLGGSFDTAGENATLTGVIDGVGSFTKLGVGTLSLRGNNTYGGDTHMVAGVLNVVSDTNLGAASGALTFDGGTLQTGADFSSSRLITLLPYGGTVDTHAFTATLSGNISGPGTFSKVGAGTLFLRGANTYTGGTILEGGILNVLSNSNLGASTGPLSFNGGTLTAAGPLTSSRIVVVLGLNGTFDTGTFASTFSGPLFGYGTFTQEGTGSLTFGGDGMPFVGTYMVNSGILNVAATGFLGGNIIIAPPATLQGNGTVTNLTSNGTVAPGNPVGTLTVSGSYIQTATGTLEVEVESAVSYDRLNVIGSPGTATVNGTLQPLFLGGYIPPGGTVLPDVLTATGGVTGTFSTGGPWELTPTLFLNTQYNPNSVDLVVTRDYTHAGLGLCPNQWQVGNMLSGLAATATGDLSNILNVIDFLPTAGAVRHAFQEISADKASALPNLGLAGAVLQQRSLAQRITNLRFGSRDLAPAASSPGGFNLFGSRMGGIMLAYNAASLAGMVPSKQEADSSTNRGGVFLDPAVIIGRQASLVKQTGYDYTLAGFTLGVDFRVRPNFLVGLATGYSHTNATFKGSGGNMTNNTWPITGYGAYLPENGYAFLSLGYSLNLFDLERRIAFGSVNRTAKSSTTGHQFNLYTEAGYDLKLKPLVVTPAVSLAYTNISVGGFTENNAGALNLRVNSQHADSLQTGVGAKVAAPFKAGSVKVVPQAYAFYQHEFSNNSQGVDARLSQGSSTMTFTTAKPKRDFAVVGGNVTLFLNKKVSAMVNYNAEVGRGNNTNHVINAGLRWEF